MYTIYTFRGMNFYTTRFIYEQVLRIKEVRWYEFKRILRVPAFFEFPVYMEKSKPCFPHKFDEETGFYINMKKGAFYTERQLKFIVVLYNNIKSLTEYLNVAQGKVVPLGRKVGKRCLRYKQGYRKKPVVCWRRYEFFDKIRKRALWTFMKIARRDLKDILLRLTPDELNQL